MAFTNITDISIATVDFGIYFGTSGDDRLEIEPLRFLIDDDKPVIQAKVGSDMYNENVVNNRKKILTTLTSIKLSTDLDSRARSFTRTTWNTMYDPSRAHFILGSTICLLARFISPSLWNSNEVSTTVEASRTGPGR